MDQEFLIFYACYKKIYVRNISYERPHMEGEREMKRNMALPIVFLQPNKITTTKKEKRQH